MIQTALAMEARVWADALGLKSGWLPGPYASFYGDRIRLVVSGTGMLAAAGATGYALGRESGWTGAVNAGIGGSRNPEAPPGTWVILRKSTDSATGRSFYPDLLWRHPFKEADGITSNAPVTAGMEGIDPSAVYDMEAAGFFSIAGRFLGPHQIMSLKWISDELESALDAQWIREGLGKSVDRVREFVQTWPGFDGSPEFPREAEEYLERLFAGTRFSETQRFQIQSWVRGYAMRCGEMSVLENLIPSKSPVHKHEHKALFERIRSVLE